MAGLHDINTGAAGRERLYVQQPKVSSGRHAKLANGSRVHAAPREERRSLSPASNSPEHEDREQAAAAARPSHLCFCAAAAKTASQAANLDFEARVPVPFSIFPSTYKDNEAARPQTQINTHEEVQITLPQKKPAGREGQHSSFPPNTDLVPHRGEHRIEEEVRITREEERYRRPGSRQSERFVKEEFR
ncbi:woronin body major, partial [Trichoderma arundinaceum]